jgi:malate dehydrogenase (oxaloacetate-decarboxylating)
MPTPDKKKILDAHAKVGGKIRTVPSVILKNAQDWSTYYTPGVGVVSEHLAKNPKDARIMSFKKNSVAVVSDGSAVLGLGNLGPYGALPVMEGKALIFKSVANIDAVPIVLDTQDTDEIVRTVIAIAPAFGAINLEDIAAPQCFEIEKRLIAALDIPVMHDDQHGTQW